MLTGVQHPMRYSFRLPDSQDWYIDALLKHQRTQRALAGDLTPVTVSSVMQELVLARIQTLHVTPEAPETQNVRVDSVSTSKSDTPDTQDTEKEASEAPMDAKNPVSTSNWDPEGGRPINPDPLEAATGGVSLEAATGGLSADDVAALLDGIV